MVAKFKKKKNSLKDTIFAIFLLLLLVGGLTFLIITNLKIKQKRDNLLSRIENLKKEVQILEEKNEGLKTEISQAGSRESLEKIAREQFNLKAPGEEVVVVSKEEKEKEESQVKEERSFWDLRNWWEWIQNKMRD